MSVFDYNVGDLVIDTNTCLRGKVTYLHRENNITTVRVQLGFINKKYIFSDIFGNDICIRRIQDNGFIGNLYSFYKMKHYVPSDYVKQPKEANFSEYKYLIITNSESDQICLHSNGLNIFTINEDETISHYWRLTPWTQNIRYKLFKSIDDIIDYYFDIEKKPPIEYIAANKYGRRCNCVNYFYDAIFPNSGRKKTNIIIPYNTQFNPFSYNLVILYFNILGIISEEIENIDTDKINIAKLIQDLVNNDCFIITDFHNGLNMVTDFEEIVKVENIKKYLRNNKHNIPIKKYYFKYHIAEYTAPKINEFTQGIFTLSNNVSIPTIFGFTDNSDRYIQLTNTMNENSLKWKYYLDLLTIVTQLRYNIEFEYRISNVIFNVYGNIIDKTLAYTPIGIYSNIYIHDNELYSIDKGSEIYVILDHSVRLAESLRNGWLA